MLQTPENARSQSAVISLSRAKLTQIPELLQMIRDYHLHDHLEYKEDQIRPLLAAVIGNEALGRLWVIQMGEEALGYLLLGFCFSLEFKGRDAFIDEFYLKAPVRGRGFGKQALKLAKEEAKLLGIKALHLEALRKNTDAKKLYEKMGFEDHDRYLMTHWLDR